VASWLETIALRDQQASMSAATPEATSSSDSQDGAPDQ
jgi:hypothetical protein